MLEETKLSSIQRVDIIRYVRADLVQIPDTWNLCALIFLTGIGAVSMITALTYQISEMRAGYGKSPEMRRREASARRRLVGFLLRQTRWYRSSVRCIVGFLSAQLLPGHGSYQDSQLDSRLPTTVIEVHVPCQSQNINGGSLAQWFNPPFWSP